jgi:hypothetical protein
MSDNLISRLEEKIYEQLDLCNTEETPTVCRLISTIEGKEKVVTLIKKKIIQQKLTIGQSIVDIELEFNINSTDN